jgi:hypothetical protein
MDRGTLNTTFSGASNGAEGVLTLQDFETGFVQNIFRSITKQLFRRDVPKADLTLKRDDKRGIGSALEHLIYIASEHLPLWHARNQRSGRIPTDLVPHPPRQTFYSA